MDESAPTASLAGLPAGAPPLPPPRLHRRRRFLRISWFLLRVIIHIYVIDILGGRLWLTRGLAQRSGMRRYVAIARRFRGLAIELGGVLIKLGQFLSARADILPAEITEELAGLQDEVPAAPLAHVLATMAAEFGEPPARRLAELSATPVAAASLGQVHYGRLHDGRAVAVKVQRPRIAEIVDIDLSAVQWAVRLVKNYPAIRRRADLELLFNEFARVLREELDYLKEAQSALAFRANFTGEPGVYFPEPYPEHSTRRVLVMERVGGIKLNDYPSLEQAGVDRAALAARTNRAFLKQFFVDGFFHADPHPGNLFVRVDGPPAPGGAPFTLIILDCGMVGVLPRQTMESMRSGMIGVATNDPERAVESLERLQMLLPGADRRQLVRALSIILRYTYDKTQRELTNMDVERIFGEVEHLVRDLPFQIPQNLIYLGRSISLVSGIVTGLHPDINLFTEVQPFAQAMIDRERRETDWGDLLRRELTSYGQIAAALPRQMDTYFKSANRGDLQINVDLTRLERGVRRVERATARLAGAVIVAALLVGGAILRAGGAAEAQWAWGAALVALAWTLWPRGE